MRLFLFVVALLCASITLSAVIDTPHVGGSIVMIEELLRTDSENPNEAIEQIQLIDIGSGQTTQIEACGSQVCENDMTAFESGHYFVKVTTDSGSVFSASIWIP